MSQSRPVRTRFAPSPTGYMHIGGMRTALFNWLWARHNGGQFILRIDDTDKVRNVDAALQPILDAFKWLGLHWDEGPEIGGPFGPYFQSQRGDLYRVAAEKLLATGKAYRDYETPEQIKADREAAEQQKIPYLNARRSLELSEAQRSDLDAAGQPFVVRLLVPRDQKVSVEDHVRGRVEWDGALIPDPVILRSDGSPLYNFATVVDDAQFEISHVIRAEEHLTNTAVQLLIYQALGVQPPEFAHIPFVAAPGSTKKLSKRELGKYRNNPQFKKLFDVADTVLPKLGMKSDDTMNPVMVAFYENVGFLPEAVLNALARLGWSLDDKTENMSREFIVENFTLDRVVKGSAGLDPDKMLAYQEHWMGQLTLEQKVEQCLPYLLKAGLIPELADDSREFVTRLVTALGERLKLFSDIIAYDEYFVADDELRYDEKAFDKRIRKPANAVELLKAYAIYLSMAFPNPEFGELQFMPEDSLAAVELGMTLDSTFTTFDTPSLDKHMHAFVENRSIGMGDIIHAVRVAVTGKPAGPGMFECLELLGRDRCLRRIMRAIAMASHVA